MAELSPDREADGVRVVLVDDDPLVRAGLRMILGGDRSILIVGEAGDGLEGVDVIKSTQPDVVLMDIRMPRLDGLEATSLALAAHPDLKIIVLTTFDTDEMVLTALRNGASGFLLKDTPPEQLVAAVHRAALGDPILSPSVTAQLIASVAQRTDDHRGEHARKRLSCLTEREQEVAGAIGRGLSNSEISEELFMSVPTVKSHVGRLFAKLAVDKIAICAHEAGLD